VANVTQITFNDLYEVILINVIIHELAHFVMDPHASKVHDCPDDRTKNFLAMLAEGRFKDIDPLPDYFCHAHFRYYSRYKFHVEVKIAVKFVEESLANSIALNQNYKSTEMLVIRMLMESEPPAYKAGLKWSMTFEELLEIGDSWRGLKEKYLDSGMSWVRTASVLANIGPVAADLRASTPKTIKFKQALSAFQQPIEIPNQEISCFKTALVHANSDANSEYEQMWALEKWAVAHPEHGTVISLCCLRTKFLSVSDRSKKLFGK